MHEEFGSLRPGMTCVATIDAEFDEPVVQVPIEAVCGDESELFAVVDSPRGLRRQPIEIGECNEAMVEVREGLHAGETVVLDYDAD